MWWKFVWEGEEEGREKILEILEEDGRGEGWMKRLQKMRGEGKGEGRQGMNRRWTCVRGRERSEREGESRGELFGGDVRVGEDVRERSAAVACGDSVRRRRAAVACDDRAWGSWRIML